LDNKILAENLILVNAFYTNSILLKGLIDYLSQYFHLHFIDLPGFINHSPPLQEISIQSFSEYTAKKIDELNLDRYIIAGISFGFLIVNNTNLDEKCKGIVAINPYIDEKSLLLNSGKKMFYNYMSKYFVRFNISTKIWKNKIFQQMAYLYSSYPRDRVTVILEHMDGKTFFKTAQIILNNKNSLHFQNYPYALIINKNDKTIDYDYSMKIFKNNINKLLIVHSDADHYPENIDESYFKQAFPKNEINRIVSFFNNSAFLR
jgi:pimeloyl-ACP methyl ester carboxylesterase